MDFEWDEDKERANVAKHKVSFKVAVAVFLGFTIQHVDDREDYGEERWVALGHVALEVYRVVYTPRGPDLIRIISARRANRSERETYYGEIFFE